MQTQALIAICDALQNEAAVIFARAAVKAGYEEFFPDYAEQVDEMVDTAFDQLVESQQGMNTPQQLSKVMYDLLNKTFKKSDSGFWFNRIYHHYKTKIKPEADFYQLRGMIHGLRVLDYGCGSGYLAARLARGGYQVVTTDVLDYRYEEARHLPFVQMLSPTEIDYPDNSIDTALVQAVLHHIDANDLPLVIQKLSKLATHLLIKEDTYDLPPGLPGLANTLSIQPLLQDFVELSKMTQYEVLILVDFYANAIAQGIPEMNMPFGFKSIQEWAKLLNANGMKVTDVILAGFEPGRMHKSCHVWLVCERKSPK
jgi:SAM-dependent methyltransferase